MLLEVGHPANVQPDRSARSVIIVFGTPGVAASDDVKWLEFCLNEMFEGFCPRNSQAAADRLVRRSEETNSFTELLISQSRDPTGA